MSKVEKTCEYCNKIFFVKNYRKENAKYCSHKCYWKSLIGTISKKRTGKYIKCKQCKKEFWVQPNEEKSGRKYCSNKCYHDSSLLNINKKHIKNNLKPIIKRGTYQKCENCGKDFYVYPYQKNRRFCSMECNKTGIYQKCENCGKEFWVKNCNKDKSKYCSKKCSDISLKTGEYKKCENCGKEFYVTMARIKRGEGKFCSNKCVSLSKKTGGYRKCKECGKEFYISIARIKRDCKYCSKKCATISKWNNKGFNYSEKIRKCLEYKAWRLSIFERDKFICQMPDCDKTVRTLNAHHIIMFSKIIKNNNIKTIEDALNCKELWNVDNGITLCEKCHGKTKGNEKKYINLFKEIIKLNTIKN